MRKRFRKMVQSQRRRPQHIPSACGICWWWFPLHLEEFYWGSGKLPSKLSNLEMSVGHHSFFYFSFISFLNIFSLRTSLNRHEKIPKKEDDKIYSIDCVYIFRDLSEQPSIDDWYLIPNQAGNCHVLRTVRYQRKNETKIARIVWFYSTDPFYPYLLFSDDDDVDKQQFSWMGESNTPMTI